MSKRNVGMSSELEAIMKQRLAKSEAKSEEEFFDALEEDDKEVFAINSKNNLRDQKGSTILSNSSSNKHTVSTQKKDSLKASEFSKRIAKFNTPSLAEEKNNLENAVSDVKKNIAKFNRGASPKPFDEDDHMVIQKRPVVLTKVASFSSDSVQNVSPSNMEMTQTTSKNSNDSDQMPMTAITGDERSADEENESVPSSFAETRMKFLNLTSSPLSLVSDEQTLKSKKAEENEGFHVITAGEDSPRDISNKDSNHEDENVFETAFVDSDAMISNIDPFDSNVMSDNDYTSFGNDFFPTAAPQDINSKFEDWTQVDELSKNRSEWGWGDNPFQNTGMNNSESLDVKDSPTPQDTMHNPHNTNSTFGFDVQSRNGSYSDDSDEETLMVGEMVPETVASKLSTTDLCLGLDIGKGAALIANNPLNGNIIVCRKLKRKWILEEYNTSASDTGAIVMQHELNFSDFRKLDLSSIPEMKDRLITKIADVLVIACGTYSNGSKGDTVRVTAITNISLLGVSDTLTVGITLNWGRNSDGKSELEYVYSLPTVLKDSFMSNNISLSIDQDLLFLGSLNANTAVIYTKRISTPNVWSAQKISNANVGIVNIAIDPISKVLALSTTDRLVAVWSYESILTGSTDLLSEQCAIEASSVFGCGSNSLFTDPNVLDDNDNTMQSDNFICESMSWIRMESNAKTVYGILALSYRQGIAILVVHLKKRNHWRMLADATLSNSHKVFMSNVTWLNMGRNCLPLVCASFQTAKCVLICAVSIRIPSFCESLIHKSEGFQMKTVFEASRFTQEHPIELTNHLLLPASKTSSLIVYQSGVLQLHSPVSTTTTDMIRMSETISSTAIGVNSEGSPISILDGVVHIQKTIEFYVDPGQAEMMPLPSYRYWLVESSVGDSDYISVEDDNGNLDEFPRAGAISKTICEIRCIDDVTIPIRIQLSLDKKFCIVFFTKNNETLASFLNVIDVHNGTNLISLPGVDSLFLGSGSNMKLVVLSEDGALIQYPFSRVIHNLDLNESIVSVPIFRERSVNLNNIQIHRVFQARSGELILFGSRKFDKRQCIFVGETLDFSSNKTIVRGRTKKIWFDDKEDLLNLCILSQYGDPFTTASIVTSNRVAILSFAEVPQIIAETRTTVLSSELVPLGSNCVAYITAHNTNETRIQYLSSSDGEYKDGLLTVIPSLCSFMIGIRQDRFVLGIESIVWKAFSEKETISLMFSRPLTKPALLLEPLLINAICSDADDNFRKVLCEKFGYKLTSSPHGDSEGIGCLGIGVSPKINRILGTLYSNIFSSSDSSNECFNQKKNLLRDISNSIGYHKNAFVASNKNFDETKHVWYRGPFDKKEEILLLDNIDEWMGKARPNVLGKIGVQSSEEKGKQTLQNILAVANIQQETDSSEVDENEDLDSSRNIGWIEGVGTGHNAEENLSLYLRFSEGTEDEVWRENGIKDLSKYNSSVSLIQDNLFDICESSSNVDEGEPGKVRALNDLVVQQNISPTDHAGLAVHVPRGSGLDVGMFHSSLNSSRQRATIELWFRIPTAVFSDEVILIRRSVLNDDDISSACVANNRDTMLWELVLVPTGHIEFRSRAGSILSSKNNNDKSSDDVGVVILPRDDHYGGWNHVSVAFSCQNIPGTQCNVSLTMKGKVVVSSILTIIEDPWQKDNLYENLDNLLNTTALYFGVGAMKGFRMTEIRAWCYERPVDDIRLNMYEYLDIARSKKKLKITIKSKGSSKIAKGGALLPPRTAEKKRLPLETAFKDTLHKRHVSDDESLVSGATFADFTSLASTGEDFNRQEKENETYNSPKSALESYLEPTSLYHPPSDEVIDSDIYESSFSGSSEIQKTNAYIQSNLISEDIRKSAAAALIRGPPATRHFGGNRGGYPHSENEPVSVSSVCVCGSEKTVIFSPMSKSPARTYPIGASGAIISDEFQGSEYLCCFIAKEKRVIVFDLVNKIVVVELQMTTKLNFWRYLPTPMDTKSLKFMLITPIGGFHWMPLEQSPRPHQVWKRGDELASKKIVSYEEGGSNGMAQEEHLTTIGLILASSDDDIEAWAVSIAEGFTSLCLSKDVLGGCLVSTEKFRGRSDPLVCLVSNGSSDSQYEVSLYKIKSDEKENTILCEGCVAHDVIHFNKDTVLEPPTMAMGESPSVLCLYLYPYVVMIIRDKGHVFKFKYTDDSLVSDGDVLLDRYVVDAAILNGEKLGTVEIVALVCDGDRDGRIIRSFLHIGTNNA